MVLSVLLSLQMSPVVAFTGPLGLTVCPKRRAYLPVVHPLCQATPSSSSSSNLSTPPRSKASRLSSSTSRGAKGSAARRAARKRSRPRVRTSVQGIGNDTWDRVDPRHSATTVLPAVPNGNDLRPESCPALVLNADFSPLSYMPLSLWPWQEVVKAVFLDRVTVVATYDIGIRSPSMILPLPSVISLKQYRPITSRNPAFTRFNVFLRDNFSCQYCGGRFSTPDLTFDHVVPRCLGGKTNWTNVVTACVSCNHAKGRRLLKDLKGLRLLRHPKIPTGQELQVNARKYPPQYLHESWRDYVYWSQSMEVENEEDDKESTS